MRELKSELDAGGIVSKARVAADGSGYGSKAFSRGALYLMLKNRIYLGDIVHKGVAHKGEHSSILDEELWARVQALLEANRVERSHQDDRAEPKPLTGIVFDARDEPMSPSHAVKNGVRYRYYVSGSLIVDRGANSHWRDGFRRPSSKTSSPNASGNSSAIPKPFWTPCPSDSGTRRPSCI